MQGQHWSRNGTVQRKELESGTHIDGHGHVLSNGHLKRVIARVGGRPVKHAVVQNEGGGYLQSVWPELHTGLQTRVIHPDVGS